MSRTPLDRRASPMSIPKSARSTLHSEQGETPHEYEFSFSRLVGGEASLVDYDARAQRGTGRSSGMSALSRVLREQECASPPAWRHFPQSPGSPDSSASSGPPTPVTPLFLDAPNGKHASTHDTIYHLRASRGASVRPRYPDSLPPTPTSSPPLGSLPRRRPVPTSPAPLILSSDFGPVRPSAPRSRTLPLDRSSSRLDSPVYSSSPSAYSQFSDDASPPSAHPRQLTRLLEKDWVEASGRSVQSLASESHSILRSSNSSSRTGSSSARTSNSSVPASVSSLRTSISSAPTSISSTQTSNFSARPSLIRARAPAPLQLEDYAGLASPRSETASHADSERSVRKLVAPPASQNTSTLSLASTAPSERAPAPARPRDSPSFGYDDPHRVIAQQCASSWVDGATAKARAQRAHAATHEPRARTSSLWSCKASSSDASSTRAPSLASSQSSTRSRAGSLERFGSALVQGLRSRVGSVEDLKQLLPGGRGRRPATPPRYTQVAAPSPAGSTRRVPPGSRPHSPASFTTYSSGSGRSSPALPQTPTSARSNPISPHKASPLGPSRLKTSSESIASSRYGYEHAPMPSACDIRFPTGDTSRPSTPNQRLSRSTKTDDVRQSRPRYVSTTR